MVKLKKSGRVALSSIRFLDVLHSVRQVAFQLMACVFVWVRCVVTHRELTVKLKKDIPLKEIEAILANDNPWVKVVPN
jgi:hypothetical protein